MRQLIIDQQTAAVTTEPFYVDGSHLVGIKCTGVSGSEVIDVQVQVGGTYQALLDASGTPVTITSTNRPFTISGSGAYVFVKPITTNPVTIQAD